MPALRRGIVRSQSCCEGTLREDSLGGSCSRVRWGSNASSSLTGGRGGGSWAESEVGLHRPSKPRHMRRNSADSGSSWRHNGRSVFGEEPRRRWRPQKGAGRVCPWDDDGMVGGEQPLWEETSRKLSLNGSSMPKIECKLEEPVQKIEGDKLSNGSAVRERGGSRRTPRKPASGRNRTSRFIGVGASNRKNQWQARILVHGKVTHLGYYRSEEEAAVIYDRVAISLNAGAATNFPASRYVRGGHAEFAGLTREDLQRALGVKPMDKSSVYKGVSRKKGKWEAKVMVNRKWAYRALFDSEVEAARAYDAAVWRLKPREAASFVNFKSNGGMGRKRSSEAALPSLTRTKSQRRDSPALTDMDIPGSQPEPPALTLDLAHIPQLPSQDLGAGDKFGELQMHAPATPTRCHSQQLPPTNTPLCGQGSGELARAASTFVLPEVMPDLQMGEPLEMFAQQPGGQMGGHMMGVSQPPFAGVSAFTSMPPPILGGAVSMPPLALGGPGSVGASALLNLPDPNSIGVPPPDNLPFPELVKQPLTTAAVTDARPLSRHSSGSLLQLMGGVDTGPMGLSSRRSSMALAPGGLPEIPAPLLPTAGLLKREQGQSMEGWSTPGQGLLGNVELHQAATPQSHQQNPFAEASTLMPPITMQPSNTLARAGSDEGHQLPLYPSGPMAVKKLQSMPEITLPGLQPSGHLQALSRLPSADLGMQPRATSDVLPAPGNMMMGGYQGHMAHAHCPPRQEPIPEMLAGGLPVMNSVGSPLDFSHLQMPKSIFDAPPGNSEGQCIGGNSYAGMSSMTPSLHGISSNASALTCMPQISSLRSGHLSRSMSTSSLMHPMQGQHPGSGLQQAAMDMPAQSLGDCPMEVDPRGPLPIEEEGNQAIPHDATDILAELGVDTREPDGHKLDLQSVQIGGDNLHTYDSAKTAEDSYILGRDP